MTQANGLDLDEVMRNAGALWQSSVEQATSPEAQTAYGNVLDFMRAGFGEVNAVEGLLIAFIATLAVHHWRSIPMIAACAALVNIVIDALLPVISGAGALHLPNVLELGFWRMAASLMAGYLIVIALMFVLKRVFASMGVLRAAHA